MGAAGEGQNITHQQKKMTIDQLKAFRDRFSIPISDEHIADIPFYKPADDSPEIKYIKKQREMLGGYLPSRSTEVEPLKIPPLADFSSVTKGLGDREISTTMAFVRILSVLLKNKEISSRIVPIVPDECRTFGMEGLFRQIGIYSPVGQLYTPVDHEQVMFYREAKDGQILEEGINEAGAFCSWIAAATSYSSNKLAMIPFYIYYSMFGFQRVGDLAWAAGDMQARGFLLGARPDVPRLLVKDCSTKTAIVICMHQQFRIVFLMIRLLLMSLQSSFKTGYTECMKNRKIFSTILL